MIYFYKRLNKIKKINLLEKNPQKKGVVIKVKIMSPKKPNSGKRPVIKCLLSNKNYILSHIPGIGHNLRQYSNVLIRGGGARDLPSVYYSTIRGVYDLNKVNNRTSRKSIYGIKTNEINKKKLRKKFRCE
jgi:small subunit ribosomal protein S12